MTGTVARFQQISRNIERTIGNLAQRPDVRRESDYYLANIRSVKSADDLLKNDRLYNFAMTAFGLKDMIYGKAFMRKVLTEGLDGPKSFALQRLSTGFNKARWTAISASSWSQKREGVTKACGWRSTSNGKLPR